MGRNRSWSDVAQSIPPFGEGVTIAYSAHTCAFGGDMSVLPAVLPRLKGIWLTLFRALFCLAFAVTLFSAVGVTVLEMGRSADAAPGWRTLTEREYAYGIRIFPPAGSASSAWRVVKVFSPEAVATGLEDDAELTAINGAPVTHTTQIGAIALALRVGEGAQTTLRVRGRDGALSDHTLTYRTSNVQQWYAGSGLNPWRQFILRRIAYDAMTFLLLGVSVILFRAPLARSCRRGVRLCILSHSGRPDDRVLDELECIRCAQGRLGASIHPIVDGWHRFSRRPLLAILDAYRARDRAGSAHSADVLRD